MQNLTRSFTMRKDGILPRGDWFTFKNLAETRPKVYIYDEIGFWGTAASDFVNQLNDITAVELEVHLNSPGGEIFDGLAIYNALKQHPAKVIVYVDGLAASAASFIAQAGDEVIMARNAQMMIHDGIAFAYGNEQDMLDTASLLSQLSNNIADIYGFASRKRGFELTTEDFRALMRAEVWYNGQEAVDAGLADSVLDSEDPEATADAKNKWDLSFYNHAGRDKAESPLRVQEKIRLENRQKENNMGTTPKATVEPSATPAPVPDGTTPPETTETTTETVETTTTQPAAEPAPEPAPAPDEGGQAAPAQPVPAPSNSSAQNGVLINGKMETDWLVINKHFASLNAAQDEQRSAHRQAFVESLAARNQIAAPQIDSLVAVVNGSVDKNLPAMSDEQFAAFQASYESAPASTLFAEIATNTPGAQNNWANGTTTMTAAEKADRVSILEGTLAMHRRTMPEDSVKKTKSYIELQTLLGNTES